jgi:hypothetical protein
MKIIVIMLGVLLAPALLAADVGTLLDEAAAVKAGDSKAWISARDKVVELGAEAVPALREAGDDDKWTREGWVRAMAAEACRLRIENPAAAKAVDEPYGLNPDQYKLFRKPAPACQRELRNLGTEGVPLLLERWRWTFESHAYSEGAAGKSERDCFGLAILFVPGAVADPRARFAMEDALRDIAMPDNWRSNAAISLGQTGGKDALAVLTEVFDSETQPVAVRAGCGWAIGRVAHITAAEALKERLGKDGVPVELKRALINGVGILGNSWGWRARGVMQQVAGDEIRKLCADMLVEAIKTMPAEADYISRALVETAWEASLAAVQDLMANGETAEIRDAAKICHEPLKIAIDRNKK